MTDTRLPPASVGVGLKPEHGPDIAAAPHGLGFFEVHAENYMGEGGAPHRFLARIRADHPLSLHGVGLSLGGPGPLDTAHLARLKALIQRYQPAVFSEHLAWSTHESAFFNDLLPLPYTNATLQKVADHIDETQEALGCRMLLENPATYLVFAESTWAETDFLIELVRRTGCGLLLDVNNVAVSCLNHERDPYAYLSAFPLAHVGEIHLAGCAETVDAAGRTLRIDAHDSPVRPDVWALYADVLARTGPVPTLIEWDNDLPPFAVLREEAEKAAALMAGLAAQGEGRDDRLCA